MNRYGSTETFRTKWDRGRVVVLGGSDGASFAVHNACIGAMRAGAGLTVAAVPYSTLNALDRHSMYKVVGFSGYREHLDEKVRDILRNSSVVVAGMGIEVDPDIIATFFSEALRSISKLAVIDADLSLAIGRDESILRNKPDGARWLMTLNLRETEGVFGQHYPSSGRIVDYCRKFGISVLLKHEIAILADDEGNLEEIENGDIYEMAVAGSGDLLSGLIGGLLAQGNDMPTSVKSALRVRRAAARRHLRETNDVVVHPSDLFRFISVAWGGGGIDEE